MKFNDLPDQWRLCTLAEIGTIVSGGTPSTRNPEYWGDETPWISPSDLTGYKEKFIGRGAKSLSKLGLENSSAKLMPEGSVHFSSRAPIGYVVISSESLCTNQGFKSLVPGPDVFNEYVYHYLKSIKDLAESRATGTTFKELSGSAFKKLPIPLPPLNEQKRIVAKIEELFSELDAGEANLRQARKQLGLYRQSLLKQAFEGTLTETWRQQNPDKLESPDQLLARIQAERQDRYEEKLREWEIAVKEWNKSLNGDRKPTKPKSVSLVTSSTLEEIYDIPDIWIWLCLDDLAEVSGGLTKNSKRDSLAHRIPYLRVANVYANELRLDEIKDIGVTPFEAKKVRLEKGDLLIVEGNGSLDQIGRVAAWDGSILNCGHQNHLIRARCLPCSDHKFNLLFLHSPQGRELIEKQAASTSGLHTLSVSKVQNLPIPLCSLPEQQEIVRILDEQFEVMEQNEREIDAALKRSEALRQSILKKAFSGQLVARDPSDEPASDLLTRISAERERECKEKVKPST